MRNVVNFSGLRNNEFLGYGNDVIKIIVGADPVALGLSVAFDPFKTEWENLSNYFALERASLLSDDLVNLDKRRDNALMGIKLVAEGYEKHFESAKKDAGERILATMEKYGKSIQNLNLLAETETVRNLVQDFEENLPVKNALVLIGLTDWVVELKNSNNEFNEVYLQRNEESSQKPDASFVEMRKPALEIYRKLIKRIDAKNELDPSAALTTLIALLEELILKYNLLVSNRAKKGGKDGDTDTPINP